LTVIGTKPSFAGTAVKVYFRQKRTFEELPVLLPNELIWSLAVGPLFLRTEPRNQMLTARYAV
jgi:hypothetical protein